LTRAAGTTMGGAPVSGMVRLLARRVLRLNRNEPGIAALAPTTNPRNAAFVSALPPLDALAVAGKITV
jgi:hypothetical protein